jgi:hypothetical protein
MSYVGIGSKANSLKALMYRSKNSVGDWMSVRFQDTMLC